MLHSFPMQTDLLPDISAISEARRLATTDDHKATWGQYFTPTKIARFMAEQLRLTPGQPFTILDPGAGTGILGAAAARRALELGASSVHLIAVEAEPETRALLRRSLTLLGGSVGAALKSTVRGDDFLDLYTPQLNVERLPPIDLVIANPPYFKMSPAEPRVYWPSVNRTLGSCT